jgi:protein SCO1
MRPHPATRRGVNVGGSIATRLGLLALSVGVGVGLLGRFFLTAGGSSRQPNPASQFAGPVFPAHLRAGSFSLIDQNGNWVTLADYRGRVVVISFMDSRAGGTSSLMATEIRGALDELPDDGRSVPVLAISVDPAHDTRASARAFLAREQMTGRMLFLLGRFAQLRPLWRGYAIRPEVDPSGRRYRYGYSGFVMLIDARGFLRVGFPAAQLVPEDLVHDLRLLLTGRG